MGTYWVYILASNRNGTLYVGFTGNIARRIYIHKKKIADGFTKKYDVLKLVYEESCYDPHDGLKREKCLKRWKRAWKLRLIEEQNPEWVDLYDYIIGSTY